MRFPVLFLCIIFAFGTTALLAPFAAPTVFSTKIAAVSSKKSDAKRSVKLSPFARKLQGVWKLVKFEEQDADTHAYTEIPLTRLNTFYFVFSGTQACATKGRINTEVSCGSDGPYTFDGTRLQYTDGRVGDLSGRVEFRGNRWMLSQGGEDQVVSEKGGGPLRYTFEKTTLTLMNILIPVNTSVPLKKYEAVARKNQPKYKRATEALLKQVPKWKATLEREAATIGVTLNDATLKKTSWGGFEGHYMNLDRWATRARQELRARNEAGAYHFALFAEETFLEFEEVIPQHQAAYEAQKKAEAERAARAAREADEDSEEDEDEMLPPSARPAARPPTAEELELQGAWEVVQGFSKAANGQWQEKPLMEVLNSPTHNYYIIFRGSTFCNYAKLLATTPEVECKAYYAPMTFDDPDVRSVEALSDGNTLTLSNGKFEYIMDNGTTKLLFRQTDTPVRPPE